MIKTAIITFAIGYILNFFGLKLLKKFNLQQNIRQEGPMSHLPKSGTPTMGGIFIIATILISVLFNMSVINIKFTITVLTLTGFGLIGFLDDYLKFKRGKNLGLTSKQKMLGIILVSFIPIGYLLGSGQNNNLHSLLLTLKLNIPVLFFFFGLFVISGAANAFNLTDGLDGLAAGSGIIAFTAFGFLNFFIGNHGMTYLCIVIAAALLAFLWFNHKPAQMFMGDVGSIALGGTLGTIALLTHTEINLLVIGGLFVIEALSVIIQVTSFKLTGKRVFRMSPIHHHFELLGWSEIKVVTRFWIIAILLAVTGLLI